MVGVAIGGAAVAGLAGSAISAGAAGSAGKAQASAANQAAQLQAQQYAQTRSDLSPYNGLGQSALGFINSDLRDFGDPNQGYLNQAAASVPGQFTQQDLEATPGYQFTLSQGLKATQNAAAARGLGVSGAALKGAAQYATGLSDQTYNTRFGQQQQNFQDYLNLNTTRYNNLNSAYNRLLGVANLGENAAATTGTLGQQGVANQGNLLASGANAQAAGQVGTANAISGGLGSLGNAGVNYALYNGLMGGGASGGLF